MALSFLASKVRLLALKGKSDIDAQLSPSAQAASREEGRGRYLAVLRREQTYCGLVER